MSVSNENVKESSILIDDAIGDDLQLGGLDFDLNGYINRRFPTEQSLSQLDPFISRIEEEIAALDAQIEGAVFVHGQTCSDGAVALKEAETMVAELEKTVQKIFEKTQISENSVYEMTKDIRKLDTAKKNLTSSITTLHHLQLLITGVANLNNWIVNRNYSEVASELPTVLNVLQLFENYNHVEQVRCLTQKVEKMKEQLSTQLTIDLKQQFKSGRINQSTADMCKVLAVLGDPIQADFCKWYLDQQLAVYNVLFDESEDVAWIDKIDERYRWFVNKLSEFERTGILKIFPLTWDISRKIALEFCVITRRSLEKIMNKRRGEIDWKLLSNAINHTLMFESLLMKRFPPKNDFNFDKTILIVFDKHIGVFVSAQRKSLEQFINECASRIRNNEERPKREINTTAIPLPSSANLFLLIKKIIMESSKLFANKENILSELVDVFKSCLRDYGHGCLSAFLPQVGSNSSSSILQSLIREDIPNRLTPEQQFFTCCLLATADWSAETSIQLEEKIKQRISVTLTQEIDLFYSISNNALTILVQDVEIACDTSLQLMAKTNWSAVEAVGDESPYINLIRKHLKSAVPQLREYFADRRKYFAHFCLKLASNLVNKFLGALFRCRVSLTGAEQLLLDTHALKTFLVSMPSVESLVVTKPPLTYTNTLHKGMTKAEMILKACMTDISTPEEFVTHFSKLLPESDSNELQKVLEMRMIKRSEQAQIIQIFRTREGSPANTNISASALPLSISAVVDSIGIGDSSSIKRLEKLVKRM